MNWPRALAAMEAEITGPEDEFDPAVNAPDSLKGEEDESGFDEMPAESGWDDEDGDEEDDEDELMVYATTERVRLVRYNEPQFCPICRRSKAVVLPWPKIDPDAPDFAPDAFADNIAERPSLGRAPSRPAALPRRSSLAFT